MDDITNSTDESEVEAYLRLERKVQRTQTIAYVALGVGAMGVVGVAFTFNIVSKIGMAVNQIGEGVNMLTTAMPTYNPPEPAPVRVDNPPEPQIKDQGLSSWFIPDSPPEAPVKSYFNESFEVDNGDSGTTAE